MDLGLELADRHWRNVVCEKGCTWDQPNLLRGDMDMDEALNEHDYYMNMHCGRFRPWNKDLRAAVLPGSLIDPLLGAAQGGPSSAAPAGAAA